RRVDTVVFILVNKAIPHYQQMCIRHSVQVGRMTPGRKNAEKARQLAMEFINQKRLDDPEIVLLHSTSLDKVNWSKGVADQFNKIGGREDISIGGIDLGQVVTAAVSVYVPTYDSDDSRPSGGLRNLKIKQKALVQPQLRYRKVLEERKTDDVRDMETSMLRKKGVSDADLQNYTRS
ncbi:hypothetical protein BGZ76_006724, partial [Entomortierella beljakovae]